MDKKPDDIAAFAAIEALYHAFLTGFIPALVTRAGRVRRRRSCSARFAANKPPASCRACASWDWTRYRMPWPAPSITIFQTRSAA
jgi:hypothetical protein